jgi:hypothetical protein
MVGKPFPQDEENLAGFGANPLAPRLRPRTGAYRTDLLITTILVITCPLFLFIFALLRAQAKLV